MNEAEARATFSKQIAEILYPYNVGPTAENRIMKAANALAKVAWLKGHVGACGKQKPGSKYTRCGDGWYCDAALEGDAK